MHFAVPRRVKACSHIHLLLLYLRRVPIRVLLYQIRFAVRHRAKACFHIYLLSLYPPRVPIRVLEYQRHFFLRRDGVRFYPFYP